MHEPRIIAQHLILLKEIDRLEKEFMVEKENLPFDELMVGINFLNSLKDKIGKAQKTLEDFVLSSITDKAKEQAKMVSKSYGRVTVLSDTYPITVDFQKKIDWDQETLKSLYLNDDNLKDKIKVSFKMDERDYKNLTPIDQIKLDSARIVSVGKVKLITS
jgi:hypothetical protein